MRRSTDSDSDETEPEQPDARLQAFRQVGFWPGPRDAGRVGLESRPIFTFVPFGHIQPRPEGESRCEPAVRAQRDLPEVVRAPPSRSPSRERTYLGWNWSTNKSQNTMFVGDSWTAGVQRHGHGRSVQGRPRRRVRHRAVQGGRQHLDQRALLVGELHTVHEQLDRDGVVPVGERGSSAHAGPRPGWAGRPRRPRRPRRRSRSPPAPALPVVQQIGIGNNVGVANVFLLQAAAAGFLGAGFVRVQMKNRPIAMRIRGEVRGPQGSKFDAASRKERLGDRQVRVIRSPSNGPGRSAPRVVGPTGSRNRAVDDGARADPSAPGAPRSSRGLGGF